MLAIAASCTKEDTQINNEYDGIAPVFTASVGATKAELIGTKVNWVANDHISVWNGTVAADYSTTGSGAIGVLLYDVDPSKNPNGAAVVQGIIDSVKAQANSDVVYVSALYEALPGIVFRTNIGVNGETGET